jgi:hypothetical protein
MAILRGFYTENWAVLFELDRALTILETEYHANGQPLPPPLEQARSQMRDILKGETSARHKTKPGETPKVSQKSEPVTIGVMEASKILDLTPQMVRRHCENGNLMAVKRGSWLIVRSSVEARKQEMGMS